MESTTAHTEGDQAGKSASVMWQERVSRPLNKDTCVSEACLNMLCIAGELGANKNYLMPCEILGNPICKVT